jgi:non-heme chloroperoxidase
MRPAFAIASCAVAALLLVLVPAPVRAAADRFFRTSDDVRLHYLDAGPKAPGARTIVFVPGWTMPAWIWERQIAAFSRHYRTVAFDPRAQGASEIAPDGYEPHRRGRDIGELLGQLGPAPVVLVGWSLGVLDSLAYIHDSGDSRIAGLVLIDNSVGEDPPPVWHPSRPGPELPRPAVMRAFVRGMFLHPPPPAWLDRLTAATLRTPEADARALLAYPEPRTFWKEAVYATARPVLYVVRPKFAGQAANLAAHHHAAESVVLDHVGHALFVDAPDRFDGLLGDFIRRRVWPDRDVSAHK